MKRSTIAVLVALCAATPVLAGPKERQGRTAQTPSRSTASSKVQFDDGAPAYSTAEDVLRALRKRRPPNVVIPSGSSLAGGSKVPSEPLFPEGWSLVSRTGRLLHVDEQWMFVFADAEGPPSLPLLRNSTLEGMIRESVGTEADLYFVVSGELTVFGGTNYLLPRLAMRADVRPASAATPQTKQKGAAVPADPKPDAGGGKDPSAEDVLAMLQEHTPPERMVQVVDAPPSYRGGGASLVSSALLPDGTPLVDRPGRLVSNGRWWTFVLESDSPESPEPPMTLLANKNAALMVKASEQGKSGTVFLVSGEVTVFDGENYLLPRTVMRRVDSGNLRN